MDTKSKAARRYSAENLPRSQRLRLAHPAERKAAREDRNASNDTKHPYRGSQLALSLLGAALVTEGKKIASSIIKSAQRRVKAAEKQAA